MFNKINKSRNKKYKASHQTKINTLKNSYLSRKLRSKKWYFLRFNNQFSYFPRIRKVSKLRFFFQNSLNVRRVLKTQRCCIKTSSLYKIYKQSRIGNPRYLKFINLLESRLDVCLYRTGLFSSPLSLRQFILHKNIYLNGCLINKPGILLKKDDLVQINFIHLNFDNYQKVSQSTFSGSSHLEIDLKTCSFIYLGSFSFHNFIFKESDNLSFLNYIFKF